jgi:hypothetical protein
VLVIRKFLEQEFADSGEVKFERLGPSPFHADFYLHKGRPTSSKRLTRGPSFECKRISQAGFDELHFYYNTSLYKTEADAAHALLRKISGELGLYYAEVAFETKESDQWSELEKSSSNLFNILTRRGPIGLISRLALTGHLIRRSVADIAMLSASISFNDQFIRKHYNDSYDAKHGAFLGSYIKELIEAKPRYPLENISDGLRYIENNKNNLWQILAIILSAIFGGVSGAIITLYLR